MTRARLIVRLVLVGVVAGAATAQACAAGSHVTGSGNSSTGAGGGGGAGGAGMTGTGGSASTGGVVHPGDGLPAGSVSFFSSNACPLAWAPFDAAVGRLILASDPDRSGFTSGTPLANAEDRTHTHTFSGQIVFPSVSYVGIAGGGNSGVGQGGPASFSGTTDPASTQLPYAQMLICKKVGQPVPDAPTIPAGMLTYVDAPLCPAGWAQSQLTRGRFIVGLPNDPLAPADASFGGDPLIGSLDGGVDGGGGGGIGGGGGAAAGGGTGGGDAGSQPALPARTHQHMNSGGVPTTAHGIELASGCCGGGYAQFGIYAFTDETDPAETGLPYIELLQCQKL